MKYAASATAITKDNVLGEIDKALEKLYGNNVRPNGKIMMEVPPWFYAPEAGIRWTPTTAKCWRTAAWASTATLL